MSQTPPPPRDPKSAHDRNFLTQFYVGIALLVVLVVVLRLTSSEDALRGTQPYQLQNDNEAPIATTQPTTSPTTQPDASPVAQPVALPYEVRCTIHTLVDPQPGWIKIRRQSKSSAPSTVHARYIADNEFRIESTNVDQLQIELPSLPVLKGERIIMRIDGQNMEVRLDSQELMTFSRSPAGRWFYEK